MQWRVGKGLEQLGDMLEGGTGGEVQTWGGVVWRVGVLDRNGCPHSF